MSQTAVQEPTKARGPLNGVDTPKLFATINVVKDNPPLAKFQFRAKNRWVGGTHSRGTIETFYGAGSEQAHQNPREHSSHAPTPSRVAPVRPRPTRIALCRAMRDEVDARTGVTSVGRLCRLPRGWWE